MSTMITRLDSKGRLVIPKKLREREELENGDVFVVDPNSAAGTITFVKVENPLVKQIAESEADYAAGRYQSLEEVAAELGVNLGGE